jgi:hypothetical protein
LIIFSFSSGKVGIDANFVYAFLINCFASLGAMILAIFVSFFVSKTKGLILLFILYILFHTSGFYFSMHSFTEVLEKPSVLNFLGTLIYYFLPRIGVMGNISSKILVNESHTYNLLLEFSHFTLTTSALILLAVWVFNKKETS